MERPSVEKRKLPKPEYLRKKEDAEREQENRATLAFLLQAGDVDAETALELVSGYAESPKEEAVEGTRAFVQEFGLSFDTLPPADQRKFVTLFHTALESRSDASQGQLAKVFEKELHKELFEKALENIRTLRDSILESEDTEALENRLRQTMDSMASLAKHASPEKDEHDKMWKKLFDEFVAVMTIRAKVRGQDQDLDAVFERVIDSSRDFIENELIMRAADYMVKRGEPMGYEDITTRIYGRSVEEVEALKVRNRKAVVEYILENKDEPPSTEVLQTLHRLNNQDIIPQKLSNLRDAGENVTFFKRYGIIGGKDVEEETEEVTDRASRVMFSTMSTTRYELAVASLHNDLLEIHPFLDRNGSTSLAFTEFMMAKRGYVPGDTREKDYYRQMRTILGNNPLALGIVGSAQWKIANVGGYYEGKTTKEGMVAGVPKKRFYEWHVEARLKHIAELKKAYKQAS